MGLKSLIKFYFIGSYYLAIDLAGNHKCNKLELGDHDGEVALVTGGHRGIGAAITQDLLTAKMHVILGCRKVADGNEFVSNLRKGGLMTGKVTVLQLDLSSLDSVRTFADQVLKQTSSINYVINNAGILEDKFKLTKDGFESNWQVNYLSHFLLVHLLLPTIQATQGKKVIVGMSSVTHNFVTKIDYDKLAKDEWGFGSIAYPRSKVAITMFTTYLDRKLKSVESDVKSLSAHPGIVNTAIYDNTMMKYIPLSGILFKSPQQGAKSAVFAALYGQGGAYIGNCAAEKMSSLARDRSQQEKLFEYSKKSLQITSFGGQF